MAPSSLIISDRFGGGAKKESYPWQVSKYICETARGDTFLRRYQHFLNSIDIPFDASVDPTMKSN